MGDQSPGLILHIDGHIVFQASHIEYAAQVDLFQLAIHPDKEILPLRLLALCLLGLLLQLKPLPSLLRRLQEFVVTDRLQQEVERIHLVAIKGILLESRSEDHTGLRRHHAG